jgi:hypothetical protein
LFKLALSLVLQGKGIEKVVELFLLFIGALTTLTSAVHLREGTCFISVRGSYSRRHIASR